MATERKKLARKLEAEINALVTLADWEIRRRQKTKLRDLQNKSIPQSRSLDKKKLRAQKTTYMGFKT